MIPLPPVDMMFDGPQSIDVFVANGQEFLGHYRDICGLKPHERMLDVGCGIGRKTIPLMDYLSGRYDGFDCVQAGVDWCKENISSQRPNFHFQHVDLRTPGYNPAGTIDPLDFRFPFEGESFDFVTLCSVVTHMQYDAMRHYLSEVARVLRPAGRCFITYFLWPVSEPNKMFPYAHDHGWMSNKDMPEQAIAFDETIIDIAYRDVGMSIRRTDYGSWSGHDGISYQDMILAEKR